MKALIATHRDGPRAVTDIQLGVTKPFRIASRKLFGFGGNLTNPDRNHLNLYIPNTGFKFVQADQSGADALIVSYIAAPGLMRDLFVNKIKPHTYVALLLFHSKFRTTCHPVDFYRNLPVAILPTLPEWKALSAEIAACDATDGRPPWYFIAKKVVHSSNYRMGYRTFQLQVLLDSRGAVVLTAKEAKSFLDFYKELFHTIVAWQLEVEIAAQRDRVLYNLFGYPRVCGELITPGYIRDLISWIPASTVACITHHAVLNMAKEVRERGLAGWSFMNQKHDSILFQVPAADVELAKELLSNSMRQDLVGRDGVKFRMGCGVTVGDDWSMGGAH